jgi:hypothetical protein
MRSKTEVPQESGLMWLKDQKDYTRQVHKCQGKGEGEARCG